MAQRPRRGVSKLSPAHLRVVRLVGKGLPNKVIAWRLGLTPATVKLYVHQACRQVKALNRTDLAVRYVQGKVR